MCYRPVQTDVPRNVIFQTQNETFQNRTVLSRLLASMRRLDLTVRRIDDVPYIGYGQNAYKKKKKKLSTRC